MRNEMIGAIVRRAIEHPEFRDGLVENPDATLQEHGFALEEEDRRELDRVRGEISGAGSDDVDPKLEALAERYGIDPEPYAALVGALGGML